MPALNLLGAIASILSQGGSPRFLTAHFFTPPSMPTLLRQEATVVKTIEPFKPGRVRFQGSWWFARCDQNITLLPGKLVNVVGRDNITLIVEPVVENSDRSDDSNSLAIAGHSSR